jgi:MFS family permease
MSSTSGAGSYRDVLALPSALPTFGAALAGRLSYGTLSLSVLFTVQQATGSFAVAGAVVGLFGVTSLLLPYKSRLVDRYGQRRVLPVLALISSSGLFCLAGLGFGGVSGGLWYVVAGTVSGLTAPPLGPSMRSTWRHLTSGTELKQRAYSLDAVCEESLYLLGPVLVGFLLHVAPASVPLAVTGALMLFGTLGMVSTPAASFRSAASDVPLRPVDLGPLRHRGFRAVVVTVLATAGGLSIAYACIAASASHAGNVAAAGYIEAALAAGSVAGGLAWGRLRHQWPRSRQLSGLVLVMAAGAALAALAPGLVALAVVMALTGLAISPLFVVSYVASDELTPEHQRTEASTWVNTANNIGSAAGAALGGVLIDRSGPPTAFLAAAAVLAVTATLVQLARNPLNTPQPTPTPATINT